MIKPLIYSFIIVLFFVTEICAQSPVKISGTITDKTKQPLEFVNVMLLNAVDSSLVKGTISDVKGNFEMEASKTGAFMIMLSQIGYEKYYSAVFDVKEDDRERK